MIFLISTIFCNIFELLRGTQQKFVIFSVFTGNSVEKRSFRNTQNVFGF